MPVKHLVKATSKEIHCTLLLFPDKQLKSLQVFSPCGEKTLLTKECLVTKPGKKLSAVRVLRNLTLFHCLPGSKNNIEWTSFRIVFTRYFTDITQTITTKTRVIACAVPRAPCTRTRESPKFFFFLRNSQTRLYMIDH